MSKFKPTFPINKDPNWKYRPSFDTDVRKTFARARKQEPLVVVKETLVVDEVQDALHPSNVRNLRFSRRAS